MSSIDELLTYGYKFDMGKYMSDGWNNFKQGAGSYVGFTILYFVIIFVLAVIPFVNFISSAVQYTLIGGFFIFTRNMLNGQENFGDFFEGFNSFAQIILYWLLLMLFMLPAIFVFIFYMIPEGFLGELMSGNPDPNYLLEEFEGIFSERASSIIFLYLLLMLYLIYLYISYSFTLILIVDKNLGFWDAMETSRKVIAKNFFSFFALYIIMAVLITIGTLITCGLGILILIPYLYNVIFAAYEDIIGPELPYQAGELEEINESSEN